MVELSEARARIDAIDAQIRELFLARLAVADDVAAYKRAHDLPVLDRSREQQKIASVTEGLSGNLFAKEGLTELFELLMSVNRKRQYQRMDGDAFLRDIGFAPEAADAVLHPQVVYQGIPGAWSHAAAMTYFAGTDASFLPVETWRDALKALLEGADYAVLPLENSTAGVVYENYDLLKDPAMDVALVGEQILPIAHVLLGLQTQEEPAGDLSRIRRVYSHPQALAQCAGYLRRVLPQAQAEAVSNTAVAAQKVREEGDPSAAAIGSEVNAALYQLSVLDRDIADDPGNQTRFAVISRKKTFRPSARQISICFALAHESGSLYHLLSHFIFNGLNLTRIESRPLTGRPWEYLFFADFEGNLQDEAVQNALLGIREEVPMLRVLGNY